MVCISIYMCVCVCVHIVCMGPVHMYTSVCRYVCVSTNLCTLVPE